MRKRISAVVVGAIVVLALICLYHLGDTDRFKREDAGYVSIVRVEKAGDIYEVKEKNGFQKVYRNGKAFRNNKVTQKSVKERLEKPDYLKMESKELELDGGVKVLEWEYLESFKAVRYFSDAGYSEEMSVETPQHVEIYLKKADERIRVIVMRDKMLVGFADSVPLDALEYLEKEMKAR